MMISYSRIALSLGVLIATTTTTIVHGEGNCPETRSETDDDCGLTGTDNSGGTYADFGTCSWGEMDTTGCEYQCRCTNGKFTCGFRTLTGTGPECSKMAVPSKDTSSDTPAADIDVLASSGPMASSVRGGIVATAAAIVTFSAFAL